MGTLPPLCVHLVNALKITILYHFPFIKLFPNYIWFVFVRSYSMYVVCTILDLEDAQICICALILHNPLYNTCTKWSSFSAYQSFGAAAPDQRIVTIGPGGLSAHGSPPRVSAVRYYGEFRYVESLGCCRIQILIIFQASIYVHFAASPGA